MSEIDAPSEAPTVDGPTSDGAGVAGPPADGPAVDGPAADAAGDVSPASELDPAGEPAEVVEQAAQDAADDSGSLLVKEGDIAADYLENLLDIIDYDGDIDLDVENHRAVVAIVGSDLKALVGTKGETLDALQELTRLAVQQKTGNRSRLMLDVSGYRQARRSELSALAADVAGKALDSGEPVRMAAMNPFERKVVHDTIAGIDRVRSESEGEEPQRRVVVLPDD